MTSSSAARGTSLVSAPGATRIDSFDEMSLKFVSHLDHWLLEVVDVVLDG